MMHKKTLPKIRKYSLDFLFVAKDLALDYVAIKLLRELLQEGFQELQEKVQELKLLLHRHYFQFLKQ